MNLHWVLTIFRDSVLCCAHIGSLKLFPSVRYVFRQFLSLPPRHVCFYRAHRVQRIIWMWVWNSGLASFLMIIQGYSRLQDWPNLVRMFQKLVQNTNDSNSEFRTFPNPVFTLMHMAARNSLSTKYLAIEENFLLTAIHVAALKSFSFAKGALPDLPADMPSAPLGYVVLSLSWSQRMIIQVVVSKIKKPMISLKLNSMHSWRTL